MEILSEILLTLFPIITSAILLGFLMWALIDLSRRRAVPHRLWWAILVIFVPLFGPMAFLYRFRRRK